MTGCGNGIVTAGEQCDEGVGNGMNLCCSATCQAIDTDHDSVCDELDDCPTIADPTQLNSDGDVFGNACDVCPGDVDNDSDGDGYCRGATFNSPAVGGNDPCSRSPVAGAWTDAKIRIIRVLTPPEGNEGVRMSGSFHIGSTLPVIAPERYGVQLRITDTANAILFNDTALPPGGTPGRDQCGEAVFTPQECRVMVTNVLCKEKR